MHVGLVSPSWPPATASNGIVTYVAAMRKGLIAAGHRVSIFAMRHDGEPMGPDAYGVAATRSQRLRTFLRHRFLGRHVNVFDAAATLASCIGKVHARHPIDIVECEESFGLFGRIRQATRVPVIVKLHGPAFVTLVREERALSTGLEKIDREGDALKGARALTAPSRCTLRETLAHYDLHPAIAEHVVNPVDLSDSPECWSAARAQRGVVLFVGRFDKVKGADTLIRAFATLLRERPAARLMFVGPDSGLVREDGPPLHFRQFVDSLDDPLVGERIDYMGRLERGVIAELRTRAAVTVVASRRESQSYTALEAMGQGCPIVVTDTSGLGEIVEDGVTGLKAAPENPAALAAQIRRLLDDPALGARLGANAREYVLRAHSIESVVARSVEVYERVIRLSTQRDPGTRGRASP